MTQSKLSQVLYPTRISRVVLIILASLCAQQVMAQSSGGDFEITRHTIDNGGGQSSGGAFTLTGTIGQADALPQTASGGSFQMTGGFWANGPVMPPGELLFADGFEG